MDDKTILKMWGASLIAGMCCVSAILGYDTVVMLLGVSGVSGIVGYSLKEIVEIIKPKKTVKK